MSLFKYYNTANRDLITSGTLIVENDSNGVPYIGDKELGTSYSKKGSIVLADEKGVGYKDIWLSFEIWNSTNNGGYTTSLGVVNTNGYFLGAGLKSAGAITAVYSSNISSNSATSTGTASQPIYTGEWHKIDLHFSYDTDTLSIYHNKKLAVTNSGWGNFKAKPLQSIYMEIYGGRYIRNIILEVDGKSTLNQHIYSLTPEAISLNGFTQNGSSFDVTEANSTLQLSTVEKTLSDVTSAKCNLENVMLACRGTVTDGINSVDLSINDTMENKPLTLIPYMVAPATTLNNTYKITTKE